jgi:O-antigen/teichoic acid export membrane protein
MSDHLKRLGSDTLIYGISTILGRFLNFLLIPLYANVFATGEYGVVTYLYSLAAFVTVVYTYGMESAFFKYSSTLELGSAKENFTTPFFSLAATSLLLSGILTLCASPIASAIHLQAGHERSIVLIAWLLASDAIAVIPFAALRLERKPKHFAAIKFLNISINVACNLVLLLVFRMGIEGVFVSGLIASLATLLMLAPTMLGRLAPVFNGGLWRALLRFGLPFIPSGLAAMAVQVIDRPILRSLTDDATVGIYQANYRLAIFMMLIVSMYDYAWRPFYFSVAKEPTAKATFARLLTYLVLFMSVVFLVLTFFVESIVHLNIFGRHIIGPDYWSGLGVVPVVLGGYLFLGIYTHVSAGIYIEKKTKYAAPVTIVGGLVNVAANFLLISSMGIMGAAWATFIAYLVMAAAMYVVSNRVYPVPYEFRRLLKITLALLAVIALYYLPPVEIYSSMPAGAILYKFGLILLFLLLMYWMNFFRAGEIAFLRQSFSRRAQPAPDPDETPLIPPTS